MSAMITDEMIDRFVETRARALNDEGRGVHRAIRAGLTEVARLIRIAIAEEIRSELVCCDIYERVGPELQARNLAGENVVVDDETTHGHQICYWGECAAVIAEPRRASGGTPEPTDG